MKLDKKNGINYEMECQSRVLNHNNIPTSKPGPENVHGRIAMLVVLQNRWAKHTARQ